MRVGSRLRPGRRGCHSPPERRRRQVGQTCRRRLSASHMDRCADGDVYDCGVGQGALGITRRLASSGLPEMRQYVGMAKRVQGWTVSAVALIGGLLGCGRSGEVHAAPTGYNDPDHLANQLQANMSRAFGDPRSHFYTPGLAVTATTCDPSTRAHKFDCKVFESNGSIAHFLITVTPDGQHFSAQYSG